MITAALLYGLAAMFASGISNAVLKHGAEHMGVLVTVILRSGISALTLGAALLILQPTIIWDTDMLSFGVLVAIIGYFPFMFFVASVHQGKVGVVAPIASGWIVIAGIFSILFFGEVFTLGTFAAFAVIVIGVIASSVHPSEWKSLNFISTGSGIPYALAAAVLWGIVFPLFKIPSDFFGALFSAAIIETFVCLTAIAHFLLIREKLPEVADLRKGFLAVLVAGVLTAGFTFSVSQGYLTGQVSIVSALAGAAIVVTVLLGRVLYKERLALSQYAGAGLVLLGIVLAAMMT